MGMAAAGIGIAGAGLIGGMMSSSKASKAAKKAALLSTGESARQFDVAMEQMEQAVNYLESIGVPKIEAQKIALERAQLDPSAMEDIETDPRLRSAQMDALARMQDIGGGLSAQERAQQQMITRGSGAQAQARDKAILQNMAERGMGGSGAELIARLQGSQSAADRASVQQAQLAGQVQNRALQSMMQAGQLGGQIRGQEFAEQTQVASAQDRIAQFNEMQRVAAQQQEELYNKQLQQRQFENVLAKRQAVAAARTGTAQAGIQRAGQISQAGQARAAGELQAGAAKSQLYGGLAQAGIKALGKADGGIIGTAGYREDEYAMGGLVGTSIQAPNSNGGFEDGGIPEYDAGGVLSQGYSGGHKFAGGGVSVPDSGLEEDNRYLEGDIVPGDSFEGDRVDAKINSGEMVLNIEQQQRLMELLKGLRDLQGLGDEDIIEPAGGGQLGEQLSPDIPLDMNDGVPASAMDAMVAQQQGQPQFGHGGMVPSKYKTPTEAKPRGIHASLKHEKDAEERSNNDSKYRKARMKAYETLINGGK